MLTINEVADLLGVARQTLAAMREDGTGPPWLRVGSRAIRYPSAALEDWIEESVREAEEGAA